MTQIEGFDEKSCFEAWRDGNERGRFAIFLEGAKFQFQQSQARIKQLEEANKAHYENRKYLEKENSRLSKSYNFDQQNLRDKDQEIQRLTSLLKSCYGYVAAHRDEALTNAILKGIEALKGGG